jgi:hypothetical protein
VISYCPVTSTTRNRAPGLGRDGQRKTVAIDFGGSMLDSVRADAFSCRGTVGEDADATWRAETGAVSESKIEIPSVQAIGP